MNPGLQSLSNSTIARGRHGPRAATPSVLCERRHDSAERSEVPGANQAGACGRHFG
jgi:hypothetical protein